MTTSPFSKRLLSCLFILELSAALITCSYPTKNAVAEMPAQSRMAPMKPPLPPTPPSANPHPAVTEEDKTRVRFAERAITLLLKSPSPADVAVLSRAMVDDPTVEFGIEESCFQNASCLFENAALQGYVASIQLRFGRAVESRHPHIVPWSLEAFKKHRDSSSAGLTMVAGHPPAEAGYAPMLSGPRLRPHEYMIHTYMRFDKGTAWHHADVILTEDAKGTLRFQRFYIIPMSLEGEGLPPC